MIENKPRQYMTHDEPQCRYNAVQYNMILYTRNITLNGELWGVCCEDLGENWSRYNGIAL